MWIQCWENKADALWEYYKYLRDEAREIFFILLSSLCLWTKYMHVWFVTRRRVLCSEGVASDWGTLVLPLAASKGQKVGGVPLGDLESGTKSESVSHPNTKLQREWQWARITTACTSSASDQHCSPDFSSVWRKQRQELRVRRDNKLDNFNIFFYLHK